MNTGEASQCTRDLHEQIAGWREAARQAYQEVRPADRLAYSLAQGLVSDIERVSMRVDAMFAQQAALASLIGTIVGVIENIPRALDDDQLTALRARLAQLT